MKKAIGGSIHRIREFELEKVTLLFTFCSALLRTGRAIGFSFVNARYTRYRGSRRFSLANKEV